MKLVAFILGCMVGWVIGQIIFSNEKPVFAVDCIGPNGITLEHTWLDGALCRQYNQYRNTVKGKDYLRGVESYYRCDRCDKVKIIHQNGDIEIFLLNFKETKK